MKAESLQTFARCNDTFVSQSLLHIR